MYERVEEKTPMPNFPVKYIRVCVVGDGGLNGRCSQDVLMS